MTKTELRTKYKALRQKLTALETEDYSIAIANQLLKLPIWDKEFYHIFLPIEKQKEVQTDFILNILSGKDKHIVVSKSNFEAYTMQHYLLTDSTKIKVNTYGIPEPVDGIPIDTKQLDVVFIPLLAFDVDGNRVGYGKGFYDRFLSDCKPETLKIGLSFFEPEPEIETAENDIKIDYCITPKSVLSF